MNDNKNYILHRGFHPTDKSPRCGKLTTITLNDQEITGVWVSGYLWHGISYAGIIPYNTGVDIKTTGEIKAPIKEVVPETVGIVTHLYADLFSSVLCVNDIVRYDAGKIKFVGIVDQKYDAVGIKLVSFQNLPSDFKVRCDCNNFINIADFKTGLGIWQKHDYIPKLKVIGNVWENNPKDLIEEKFWNTEEQK